MSTHRDLVSRSKLFQQFDRLADFEDVTQADVDLLKAMVLDVAARVGPHLDWARYTFQQHTAHDARHLLNVAAHVHNFLPRRKWRRAKVAVTLNAVELAYLWLAILLHDVGMLVSGAGEKQAVLDSPAYQEFLRAHGDRLAVARAAEAAGRPVPARVAHDALLAGFIRRRHAERVRGYARAHLPDRLWFRGTDLAEGAGTLCASLTWGVRGERDARRGEGVDQLPREGRVGTTRVNLAYLACCFRLGDALDFDRSRTPLSASHQIYFTPPLAGQEWNTHLGIAGVSVTEHRVRYEAACATPADYAAAHHFLDGVDRELRACTRLVREFPPADAARYLLNLAPVADRHGVGMANPRVVAGEFQLEPDRVVRLLMDKSLFPDESLFLRELLQNALDACRHQQALAEEEGMGDKYVPRIQVDDHSAEAPGAGAGPRVVFRDNGVGMSLHQVEAYFMRVGTSFYASPDFQAERERLAGKGIRLDAGSRLGTGFLSCFLGGGRVEVETYRYGSEPLKIALDGPGKYFVVERVAAPADAPVPFNSPADPSRDAPPRCSGTTVTVYLRAGWRRGEPPAPAGLVYQTLNAVAVNQTVPITITEGASPRPRVVAASRWDHAAPEMPRWRSGTPTGIPLLPAVFSLADYGDPVRGRGAIWFLADGGRPAVRKGDVTLSGGRIRLGTFITAVRELAATQRSDREDYLDSLGRELKSISASAVPRPEALERLLRLGGSSIVNGEYTLLGLLDGDHDWALKVARTRPGWAARGSGSEGWGARADEVEALLGGDRDRLARIWCDGGLSADGEYGLGGKYRLALFGIESPGGFQTWDAAAGDSARAALVPDGASVTVDAYGDVAPEPVASRRYVPDDRSRRVRSAVTRAFLLYARQLWKTSEGSRDWVHWYESFLAQWRAGDLALLRADSDVRRLVLELRDARPREPNDRFYRSLAEFHSPFGGVVVTRTLDGWAPLLDLRHPISREHIDRAAAKVGLDAGQVPGAVDSLSEVLGWDITKGRPAASAPPPPPNRTSGGHAGRPLSGPERP